MKTKNADMIKDDEVLRIEAMEEGPIQINGLTFQPVTALTLSWMQRNNVFDEAKDIIWRSAAFAYLHTQDRALIRAVVNDKATFDEAVDLWIESHLPTHKELPKITQAMNDAFARYIASVSEGVPTAGGKKGSGAGK